MSDKQKLYGDIFSQGMASMGVEAFTDPQGVYTQEGFRGAASGWWKAVKANFGLGDNPKGRSLAEHLGHHAAAARQRRQALEREIEVTAKQLALLKAGDVKKAREAAKVGHTSISEKKYLTELEVDQVIESAALGAIIPFWYGMIQGSKEQDLQIKLAGMVAEMKTLMSIHRD